jgi:hypothetical protein
MTAGSQDARTVAGHRNGIDLDKEKYRYEIRVGASLVCAGLYAAARPSPGEEPTERWDAALEKELFAIELNWRKAEFDKKMDGPESMGELSTDDCFDVLPAGRVVNKQEIMARTAKNDRQPGTGAFPDHLKLRAVYGNVALAADHTTIKGVDANGKIVQSSSSGKWECSARS